MVYSLFRSSEIGSHQCFSGMTETCTSITMFPASQYFGTQGSAGQLIPATIARIVKADGSLANYGEEGELHVTGPSMALRYVNNDEA